MPNTINLFASISPTTEIEAVNIMLSTIGEAPINSFEESSSDIAIARNTLSEVSKAVQLEGWQWNTEDNYPLIPDSRTGKIRLAPNIVRVHFREPDDREYVVRGQYLYDRINHTLKFPEDFKILVTVTLILPFDEIPEAARRYTVIRAARVFQQRVVGSGTLHDFTQIDEVRARASMLAEERRYDRPNILKGSLPATGTWNPVYTLMNRGGRQGGIIR